MSRRSTGVRLLLLLIVGAFVAPSPALVSAAPSRFRPRPVAHDPHTVLTSTSTGVRFKPAAGADTFALYGGPGSLEGRFQEEFGNVPDAQGWITVDITDDLDYWQPSTFNTSKKLTPEELSRPLSPGNKLAHEVVGEVAEQQRFFERSGVIDLRHAFDQLSETIFVDAGHVTPLGNAAVADAMLPRILDEIAAPADRP